VVLEKRRRVRPHRTRKALRLRGSIRWGSVFLRFNEVVLWAFILELQACICDHFAVFVYHRDIANIYLLADELCNLLQETFKSPRFRFVHFVEIELQLPVFKCFVHHYPVVVVVYKPMG